MKFTPLVAAISGGFLTSTLIYYNPFKPLFLLFFWRDRLGIPLWPLTAGACLVIASLIATILHRRGAKSWMVKLTLFFLPVILPTLVVGGYAEFKRAQIIESSKPDQVIQRSFLASLRDAPADFQFFLHAAALKNCHPYAWSYRMMSFYELSPNVATNVLPEQWIEKCRIKRTR
jgi:hypothetical protein